MFSGVECADRELEESESEMEGVGWEMGMQALGVCQRDARQPTVILHCRTWLCGHLHYKTCAIRNLYQSQGQNRGKRVELRVMNGNSRGRITVLVKRDK